MKTGRLSKPDLHFIEEKATSMTADQIAEALGRHVEPIIRQLKKMGLTENKLQALTVQAEYDLRGRHYWKILKTQFSEEELDTFMSMWTEIIAQFQKDVLVTEEMQIVGLVKESILSDRALTEIRSSHVQIAELRNRISAEMQRPEDEIDRELIYDMEKSIASMLTAIDYLSRNHKDHLGRISAFNKELKATREQRYAKMESKTETMPMLINKLLNDPTFYDEQGKMMEKMRLSMYGEKARLGAPHTYDDGMQDRPLLNAETVILEDE